MVSFLPIVRQQLGKLGILLLICLSLRAAILARENGHPVTVGVFGLFRPERVDITTSQNATIVSIQSGLAEMRQVLAVGQRLQVENREKRMEIKLFERDERLLLTHTADAVRVDGAVCTLSVPNRIQRDFSGRLEVVARQGVLLLRVTVEEESAVQQILRSEMAECQEPEALKAQAILVRTYLRTSNGRHLKDGHDFCDTTHCQFFTDFTAVDDRFRHAVMATRGLVVTFLGKSFQPLYTAACGGRTLAGFADGSGEKRGSGYPYRSVSCSFCAGHPLFEWETTVTTQELLRVLKGSSPTDPTHTLDRLTEPGEAGDLGALKQTIRLSVGRALGWNIIRSNRYSIEIRSNSINIKGHGSGHNFGLCQAGAIEMARQGKAMTEILTFYFPGCRIEQ